MLRNTTPRTLRHAGAIAFSALMASMAMPAQAISVNDMVVWSASKQPLRMDVELVDLQGVDLRDLKIVVASAAEHERMGLKRPDWADAVSFKVLAPSSSKVIARATSGAAIDADFVSFLISIRGSGLNQLQQVASKVSASGAEPLASAQAEPVAARPARQEPATVNAFADKPYKPAAAAPAPTPKAEPVAPAPVTAKPKPAPVAAASAPAPAPAANPAPAELVAAAEADSAEVLADVGAEPTLESLQAERTQLAQQIADLQTRLGELDQQIAALNPDALPAAETADAPAAEAAPVAEQPAEGKLLGYTYFSNIMLGLLAVFMSGMIALDRLRASKR